VNPKTGQQTNADLDTLIYDEAIYYIFDENHHVVDNNTMIKKEDEKGYNNCSHIGKEKLFDLYLRKIKKFTILTRTILETIENFLQIPVHFFGKITVLQISERLCGH